MRGRRSRKRPWDEHHRDLDMGSLASMPRTQSGPDGREYRVQRLSSSAKAYTCPACARPIPLGTAHVVAWPLEAPYGLPEGVDARRHWHSECWRRGLRPL